MRKTMQPQHVVEALKNFIWKGEKVWEGQQFLVNWLERKSLEKYGWVKRLEERRSIFGPIQSEEESKNNMESEG